MEPGITHLRIIHGDENEPEIVIPLSKLGRAEFYSMGSERLVTLTNGEVLDIYAEVSLDSAVADISLSVLEGERTFAIRCGSGLVFSYTTLGGLDLYFQIGTGPWE